MYSKSKERHHTRRSGVYVQAFSPPLISWYIHAGFVCCCWCPLAKAASFGLQKAFHPLSSTCALPSPQPSYIGLIKLPDDNDDDDTIARETCASASINSISTFLYVYMYFNFSGKNFFIFFDNWKIKLTLYFRYWNKNEKKKISWRRM